MSPASLRQTVIAVTCLGLAACATTPADQRARIVDFPLASRHADFAFTIMTGPRQALSCDEKTTCAMPSEGDAAVRFSRQVSRVASALQRGAQKLYPDLAARAPRMLGSGFDVFVVEGSEPGSDSSANGRIALNAALGTREPYDEWLAFIIAREMGHVIARHHEENSGASIATSILMNILIPGSSLLKSLLSAGGSGIAARSKREVQSQEADVIARRLLAASGFPLNEVSLALRLAPALPADNVWSNNLKASSEGFVTEVASAELAVESIVLKSSSWQGAALAPGY